VPLAERRIFVSELKKIGFVVKEYAPTAFVAAKV